MEKTAQAMTPALSQKAVVAMAMGFSRAAQQVESIDDLDQMLADRLGELNIPNFILYQVTDRNKQPTAALKCGRSNKDWRDYYMSNCLAAKDEVLLAGTESRDFFTWGQRRLKGPAKPLTPDPNFIFGEALQFGLVDGFYMPLRQEDRSTYAVSMMSTRELPTDDWLSQSLFLMAYNYTLAVLRLEEAGPDLKLPGEDPTTRLTKRQRECLYWVRAGKTDWEIGQILGISQHTVIEHLEDARNRLNVRNRTQAVIEAVIQGIIPI